jgi:Tol biopolymer transport system component
VVTRRLALISIILAVAFLATEAFAQGFGKNKVQYRNFDWRVVRTENFDIYFYEGEDEIVKFAQQIAEGAYEQLAADIGHKLKNRVPIIIYNSQNDFQQTNVILELIEESVGGFTELYKNRVVVPFTGSYEEFRHVLVHELTHAFEFDLLFGGVGSIFPASLYAMELPLWVYEGLSEFTSLGWDEDSDMYMRDLVVNEKLVPLDELAYASGYVVYKEGQSVYDFIAEKYGRKKIGEVLHQAKMRGGLNGAVKSALGISIEQLDEAWARHLKKKYWPLLTDREEVSDVGRKLTDHVAEGGVYNTSPALSPDGDRIAFLSDRTGRVDLLVASAIDGKILKRLVKGESSSGFESMHTRRAGLSFSPDGKSIAFAAKAGSRDRLYIVNAVNGRIEKKFEVDLDGLFSPSFSPDGRHLAFVGLRDGFSDVYVLDRESGSYGRLTHDRYDDRDPSWSQDGTSIIFSSDRPDTSDSLWRFGEYAVFLMSNEGSGTRRLTARSSFVATPQMIDSDGGILYVSDLSGTKNLYSKILPDGEEEMRTNVLGGIFDVSASQSGQKIAFSAYNKVGWDVFVLKEPLKLEEKTVQEEERFTPRNEKFDEGTSLPEKEKVGLAFSPDWAGGGVTYSSEYGFSGETEIAVSDILGNHRIYFASDLFGNIVDSNFYLEYWYLPRRIDYGGGLFQQKDYYVMDYGNTVGVITERTIGAAMLAGYPFNRFDRIEMGMDAFLVEDKYYVYEWGSRGFEEVASGRYDLIYVIRPGLSYVHDTSMWGITGPMSGSRLRISVDKTLPIVHPTFDYITAVADLRKYLGIGKRHSLAFRLVGAGSMGDNASAASYWIGGSQTLRGYEDYEFYGTQVALFNMEFRYPFVDRLKLGFPLPLDFRSVRGALFLDAGGATNDWHDFRVCKRDNGEFKLDDLKMGFGIGLRMNVSFLVLKLDAAKRTDLSDISKETRWYFTLGSEF